MLPTIATEGNYSMFEELETLNQENQESSEEVNMFVEEDETEEVDTPAETEEVAQETDTKEASEPVEETPKNDDETAEELFEVKYNGETSKKTREEIITLAQKGMNYDKVLQERDSLRNSAEIQLLDKLAKSQNMSREQFMGQLENALEQTEIQKEMARLREQYPTTPDALLEQTARMAINERKANNIKEQEKTAYDTKAEQTKRDIETFMNTYPAIDIRENFTEDMLQEASNGKGLVAVWQEKLLKDKEELIRELEAKNQRAEQEIKNKKSALSSVTSNDSDGSNDTMLKELLDW